VLKSVYMDPSEFVKVVVEAYRGGRGVFANKVNAEDMLPPQASDLEKSLFLFYVIQLDYATKSQRLYEGARMLFSADPRLFDPVYVVNLSDDELRENLQTYLRPRYINEAVRRYRANSRRLLDDFGGDPRRVFDGVGSAKEALRSVRTFRGFGPKIGNFFVRTMINTFGYPYPDVEDLLPPVDVHDVRIAYLLGFSAAAEMSGRNIAEVKELWSTACREAGVSWLVFDKALWLLGSEGRPKTREDVFGLIS